MSEQLQLSAPEFRAFLLALLSMTNKIEEALGSFEIAVDILRAGMGATDVDSAINQILGKENPEAEADGA